MKVTEDNGKLDFLQVFAWGGNGIVCFVLTCENQFSSKGLDIPSPN